MGRVPLTGDLVGVVGLVDLCSSTRLLLAGSIAMGFHAPEGAQTSVTELRSVQHSAIRDLQVCCSVTSRVEEMHIGLTYFRKICVSSQQQLELRRRNLYVSTYGLRALPLVVVRSTILHITYILY